MREVALHLSSRADIAQQRLVAVPALADVGRAEKATLTATLTVTNASAQPLEGLLTGDVRRETGGPFVLTAAPATAVHLPPGVTREIILSATLPEPTLWHFDHPHLYRWEATLRALAGPILHTAEETFGVRAIELRRPASTSTASRCVWRGSRATPIPRPTGRRSRSASWPRTSPT